ncbi:MAG: translation termination inhibitor protein itt1 [Bogoriella megaspora]|nr:MAG: translation termination inhibitor protein itt1 [Bogoriella megaspora]
MAETESDDERAIELDSTKAIFDELSIDPEKPHTATIEIPVAPEAPLPIAFPSADGAPPNLLPTPPSSDHDFADTEDKEDPVAVPILPLDIHYLRHLPPIGLQIILPEGYPSDAAPQFTLSCEPKWVPDDTLRKLEWNGLDLWEEYGHDQVVYTYIDQLKQSAECAFGLAVDGPLELSQNMRIALLDYDKTAKRQKFDQETFDCGICLEPKKGVVCHRMNRCEHVFCIPCLQDFYNNAITEGDISGVKCLAPDCGSDLPRGKKQKTLSPAQLLQIPIEHNLVKRYVELKRKKKFESDPNTIYCPRKWCQGPACSKKTPKATDFAAIDSDDSSDDEAPTAPIAPAADKPKYIPPSERLAICSVCDYAFCRVCQLGWHGEYQRCSINPKTMSDLTAEDKASYDYIRLNTSPCPTCASPCQKTHGCNHMRCFQCGTHFCYLCSSWLDGQNPYSHFNQQGKGCYMRLWELEEGDEGQGANFAGARAAEVEAFRIEQELLAQDAEAGPPPHGVEVVRGVVEENGDARGLMPPAPVPPRAADVPVLVVQMNEMNLQGRRAPNRGGGRRDQGEQRPGRRRQDGEQEQHRNNGIERFEQMANADDEVGWGNGDDPDPGFWPHQPW